MKALLKELKRRNVLRVAVLYVVLAWLILQVADVVFALQQVPDWAGRLLISLLLLGFPLVVVFAWVFEITPEGIKREAEIDRSRSITARTGRRIDVITAVVGGLAILLIVLQAFVPGLRTAGSGVGDKRASVAAASIAVLPFANMSSDPEQEYFSDGLSEELLNLLAKIPELTVISRTSSFQFKGRNEDVRAIGGKLGVAHVLEGSVRKSGNTVRITAQLINALDGAHLWSETYDRNLDDIFAVQDEIARAVVNELQLTILGDVPRTHSPPHNTDAYNLLLQARHFADRRTGPDMERAVRYLEQALQVEPDYAQALAELSRVLMYQVNMGVLSQDDGVAQARAAAQRSIEIDPTLPDGHIGLANIALVYDWDWAGAVASTRRAELADTTHYEVVRGRAGIDLTFGEFEQAAARLHRLVVRDPLRPNAHQNLALALMALDSLDAAERALRQAIALTPGGAGMQLQLVIVRILQGRAQEAISEALLESDEAWRASALALAYAAAGHKDADAALRRLQECCAAEMAYQVAEVYALRGERDRAFEWLERAYRQRDGGLTEMKRDRLLDNIRSDPRYAALLRRLKLPA